MNDKPVMKMAQNMPTRLKWIVATLSPLLIIFCVLSFGDSQWGRHFYMWQTYVYPQEIPERAGSSETWLTWHANGALKSINSSASENSISYYDNGNYSFVSIRWDNRKMDVKHLHSGDLWLIRYHYLASSKPKLRSVSIFSKSLPKDLRSKFTKEIEEFKTELAKFEKVHGIAR
jgi:hypothetical protein